LDPGAIPIRAKPCVASSVVLRSRSRVVMCCMLEDQSMQKLDSSMMRRQADDQKRCSLITGFGHIFPSPLWE
jgi:hypothetical protein